MCEVVSTVPPSEFHQIAQDFKAPWSPDRGWAFTGTINFHHQPEVIEQYLAILLRMYCLYCGISSCEHT